MVKNLPYQIDCGYTEGILGMSVSSRTLPGLLPSCKSSCYFPICWFNQYWSWTPDRDTQGTYRTGTQPVTQTRCCLQQQVLLIGFSEGESAPAVLLTESGGYCCRHTHTILARLTSKRNIIDPLSLVSLHVQHPQPDPRHSYWPADQLGACCRHTHPTGIPYSQVCEVPAWTLDPLGTPVQTQTQTQKVESEVVKEGVNKKAGETLVLRGSAQSDKHTNWPHFTHNLPSYTHLSLFPPSLIPAFPSPGNSLISLHISASFTNRLHHPRHSGLPSPGCLQVIEIPPIAVADEVCSGWTGLWATWCSCRCSLQDNWIRWPLKVPSNSNDSKYWCFLSLPLLFFFCQVCVPVLLFKASYFSYYSIFSLKKS